MKLPPRNFPDEINSAPAPLPKLAREYLELRERAVEAGRRVEVLEAQIPEAEQEDRDAHSAALRAGKSDPGATTLVDLSAEIDAASHEGIGLADACSAVFKEMLAALADQGPKWLEKIEADRLAQLDKADKALVTVEAAARGAKRLAMVSTWLSRAVDPDRSFPSAMPNGDDIKIHLAARSYPLDELAVRFRDGLGVGGAPPEMAADVAGVGGTA